MSYQATLTYQMPQQAEALYAAQHGELYEGVLIQITDYLSGICSFDKKVRSKVILSHLEQIFDEAGLEDLRDRVGHNSVEDEEL